MGRREERQSARMCDMKRRRSEQDVQSVKRRQLPELTRYGPGQLVFVQPPAPPFVDISPDTHHVNLTIANTHHQHRTWQSRRRVTPVSPLVLLERHKRETRTRQERKIQHAPDTKAIIQDECIENVTARSQEKKQGTLIVFRLLFTPIIVKSVQSISLL